MVFEGGESTTLYGIVTDIKANIDGLVSAITVLGADGEEVEYSIVKVTGYDRPEYGTDIFFGSYIKANVSEDGTIDTDAIAYLYDPNTDDWSDDAGIIEDTNGCTINNSRIQLDGVYYTLNKDTLVFQTKLDEGAFDKAEVIDVADLIAADAISGGVLAFVKDGVVKQIFLLDSNLNSSSNYGIIDSTEYRSGNWYATLLGGSEYKTATSLATYADVAFVAYTVSDSKLAVDADDVIVSVSSANNVDYYNDGLGVGEVIFDIDEDDLTSTSSLIMDGSYNYTINDDTVFYVIKNGKITEGDIYDVEDGVTPLVCITTDDYTDDILAYVFIVVGGGSVTAHITI